MIKFKKEAINCNVGRPQRFDEKTKIVSFRVPLSKETEIRNLINEYLIKLEK